MDVKQYQVKTWLTRPRPEIDRFGLAWLIARFIDRKPRFAFASTADGIPGVIPFDMLDAEFSHHGSYCTFETLTRRFSISEKSLVKIGDIVHDTERRGFEWFDALYAFLQPR